MKFKDKVKNIIEKYNMLTGGETVLVALSGGPDSVALLSVLKELQSEYRLTLLAVYIDHGLRPNEVGREIEFCQNLCRDLSVSFSSLKIKPEELAQLKGLSLQEAARILRYEALKAEALRVEADRIATGHHGTDQAETLLLNLIRGSGMKGLSGIPPVRGIIIRPLIELHREDIEAYLKEKGLRFVIDSSNLQEHYLRNRLRKQLIPILKQFNPAVMDTLMRTAEILRQENDFIEIQVNKTLIRLISRKTDKRIELFLSPLEAMDRVILRRALRRAIDEVRGLRGITFNHIESIIEFIYNAKTGDRLYLPGGYRVIKSYSTLLITSEQPVRIKDREVKLPGETEIQEAMLVITASISENVQGYGDGKWEVVLDLDTIELPLRVRARKQADEFFPFGLGGRKKLHDFFIDEKVPRDERDSVPLIVSADDKIVWVVGYRIDDRFKVTSSTKRFLRLVAKVMKPRY